MRTQQGCHLEGQYGCCSSDPDGAWIDEGTARSIQDKFCVVTGDNPFTCETLDEQQPGSSYGNDVAAYLQNPNQSINLAWYKAALFWNFLTGRFGTSNAEPERGIDFLLEFFDPLEAGQQHGIATIEDTLAQLGLNVSFRDAFRDFALTNYVKDIGPGVPVQFRYVDEGQLPGSYGPVALAVSVDLAPGDQSVGSSGVAPWAARYFEFRADPAVATIDFVFDQQLSNDVHYHVFATKGGATAKEAVTGRQQVYTVTRTGV